MLSDKNIALCKSILLKAIVASLLAFHIVPLLISAFYALPTSVDDYCYADTVKKFGMFEAMRMYYTQVTGRFLSTFLQHILNPLSYGKDFDIGFKILPVAFWGGIVAAVYTLLKQIFVSERLLVVSAFLFVSVFTSQLPSISEGLFWFASVVVHWLGLILFFVNCAFLLKLTKPSNSFNQTLGIATVTLLLSAGASEPAFLSFVLVCFAVLFYQIVRYRKLNKRLVWLAFVSLVGVALIKFSSSNIGKQNVALNELTVSVLFQVLLEIVSYARNFLSIYLGIVVVIYLLFFGNSIKQNKLFQLPMWYVLLVSMSVIYFNHFVGVVGVGGSAPRVWNGIYLYFIVSLFFIVSVLWHKYGVELQVGSWVKIGLIVVALAASLRTNTWLIYKDVRHGTFEKYTTEIEKRKLLLESASNVVELPWIQNKPYSLFFYDMNTNPHGLWSKCLGDYYEKQQVTFTEK